MSISALPLFNSNAKTWKARTSVRTLIVLFTITLVLGLLFILDYPLYPFTFQVDLEASPINIPKYTAIHEPSEGVSYVDFVNETSGVQATYHSFSPEPAELAIGDHNVRPIHVHQELSDTCLERWVAHGRWDGPCNSIDESVIDVIWVWVNGSDPLDALSRSQYVSSTGYHSKNARFREHDELRYSFRAAAEATQSWKQSVWHVVTADVPHPEDESRRLGLVPQWLDINASSLSRVEDSEGRTPVHLIHHSQLFRLLNSTNAELTAEDAFAWKDGVLPTFNSYSIESQLPNLDPRTVSENLVSLNDDQFLALPMSPSSFHTPLYGPVFRFDSALKVGGDASGKADGGGEWRSLGWTAHLMNVRFGSRKRAYVHHNARSLSLPLMHEASLAFPAVFSATPLSRFRGSHSFPGKGEIEVNTMFLATHWVIERKREALLWSYIVAKWGGESGTLSSESKDAMWREMGGKVGRNSIRLNHIRKTTVDDVDDNLRLADLQSPRASDSNLASHTEYAFVSQDGYPASWSGMPLSAKLYRSSCLGKEPVSAWDLFLEVLRDKPDCGDAIIAAVIQQEGPGGGLAMFLPPGDMESTDELRLTLPLHPPADAPPLPTTSSNLRAFAVRLLHRYSFAIGDTPSRFFGLTSYKQGLRVLKDTSAQKDIALLCINDDMPENSGSDQFQKTDALLREWLEDRWSTSGDWELPPN